MAFIDCAAALQRAHGVDPDEVDRIECLIASRQVPIVCEPQASKRALPASGIGTPGEKAATAIADFLVVDMFANYCTGSKDAKTSISDCERQLKRIYR